MKKLFYIIAVFTLIVFTFTACGGSMSNKGLQKLLKKDSDFSDFEHTSAKVINEIEIDDDTKAVLFSGKLVGEKLSYHAAIANKKTDDLSTISFAYEPLTFLQQEISLNRPQAMNTALFEKTAEKLKSDIKYFNNQDNCIEFLREITGKNGIMATDTAKGSIEKFAKDKLETDNLFGIFEEDNANPMYYAINGTDNIYSWDWLPESQYLTYASSSTQEELKKAEKEHGPAYSNQNVWIAYDLSGEKKAVFKTKSELLEYLTGEKGNFEEEEKTAGTLKLATVTDNSPFSYISDGAPVGAEIDIAKAIADSLNMELEISTMASASAIKGTANGTYHMAMAAYTVSTKGNGISFTDNYYDDYVIVLNENGGKTNDKICGALAELKGNGTIDQIIANYSLSKAEQPKQEPEKPKDTPKEEPNNPSSSISYRVRKSADDSKSQIGAFASLENAKKEANAHKNEGYKVYDMTGKLIYTP